eukprot:g4479.t1
MNDVCALGRRTSTDGLAAPDWGMGILPFERSSEDKDETLETLQLVTRELACFSCFTSVCSLLPSVATELLLSSVTIGPFSSFTFALSAGSATVMLLMAPQIFHAAAGASALAGLGQVLFLVLNQPAVVHFYILPNIMVMDLFNGMQSPFVAMHMLVHLWLGFQGRRTRASSTEWTK